MTSWLHVWQLLPFSLVQSQFDRLERVPWLLVNLRQTCHAIHSEAAQDGPVEWCSQREMFLVPMQPDKHRSCWDVDLVRATGDRRPLCPFCQANFGVGSFSAIASQEQRFARIRLLQDVKLMLDCLTCFLYRSHSICSSLLFIFEG